MKRPFAVLPLLTSILTLPGAAQKPVINPGGVVNASSFIPAPQPGHEIAPGSIASIFGSNLASSTMSATNLPLPTVLGGTSVTVNGAAAPLFFVSPGQINFEVPSSTLTSTTPLTDLQASVVVTSAAGASGPVSVDVAQNAPGLFTQAQTGCCPASALNVSPAGETSVNSSLNSAAPGQFLALFGTGFGAAYFLPPDGYPAPSSPLPWLEYGAALRFEEGFVSGSYVGRAPGLVGVDQINVFLPGDVPQGCSIPVTVVSDFSSTPQQVTISVHAGGGQCVNPPISSGGLITIQKSVVLNDSTIPEADTLTANLSAEPAKTAFAPFPSSYLLPCAIPGFSYLSAGTMFISGPGLPAVTIPPSAPPATAYSASLPASSITPGAFTVSATGGADVGPFTLPVNIEPGIQVTSQFAKGSQIAPDAPITVNWTGGEPGLVVNLHLISHSIPQYDLSVQVPASAGNIVYPFSPYNASSPGAMLEPSDDFEIQLDAGPDPSEPQLFTATGLTLGGQVQWNYQYRFVGLLVP